MPTTTDHTTEADLPRTLRSTPRRATWARRGAAVASAALIGVFGVACSDDDGDGDPEVEAPDVTSPDLDPGEGDGVPGDSSDEAPGDTGATDDLPDVDVDVDNDDSGG